MEAPYHIETDPRRSLLQLRFTGQWNKSIFDTFKRDAEAAMKHMVMAGAKPGSFLVLVDARDQGVNPQDVASEMQAMIGNNTHLLKQVALLLSGSALQKMQVNRVAPNDHQRIFSDRDEAMKWLLAS